MSSLSLYCIKNTKPNPNPDPNHIPVVVVVVLVLVIRFVKIPKALLICNIVLDVDS